MNEKDRKMGKIILSLLFVLSIISFIIASNTAFKQNSYQHKMTKQLLEHNNSTRMYNLIYNTNNNNKSFYDLNYLEKINYNNYLTNITNIEGNSNIKMLFFIFMGGVCLIYVMSYFDEIFKPKKKKKR